jgi:hypothetical protein
MHHFPSLRDCSSVAGRQIVVAKNIDISLAVHRVSQMLVGGVPVNLLGVFVFGHLLLSSKVVQDALMALDVPTSPRPHVPRSCGHAVHGGAVGGRSFIIGATSAGTALDRRRQHFVGGGRCARSRNCLRRRVGSKLTARERPIERQQKLAAMKRSLVWRAIPVVASTGNKPPTLEEFLELGASIGSALSARALVVAV